MADTRLRSLERQASTGDIEAQAKLDRERIRVGERGVIPCEACKGRAIVTLKEAFGLGSGDRLGRCVRCDWTGFRLYRESVRLRVYCGDNAARKVLGPGGSFGLQPA